MKKTGLATLVCVALLYGVDAFAGITGYRPVFLPFPFKDKRQGVAIREFKRNGKASLIVVDAETFETFETGGKAEDLQIDDGGAGTAVTSTPFYGALHNAPVKSTGAVRGKKAVNGWFVTIDLCPSGKRLDKVVFEKTEALAAERAAVAIAISGGWIKRHKGELEWLLNEARSGRLDVTWINHSYSHPYNEAAGDLENFLLTPGTDFEKEVLANEVLMLENRITPSPFFRFPGLVANEDLIKRLKRLSLIPVGALAWLAKGETPENGSIILIHGNGNEPAGMKRLLSLYEDKAGSFKAGSWRLLPLREAFTSSPALSRSSAQAAQAGQAAPGRPRP